MRILDGSLLSSLLVGVLGISSPVHAAPSQRDPAGNWTGQWERDGSTLDVEVAFTRAGSGYEGEFSSAQLRVVGIPFTRIRYEEPKLSWDLVGDATTSVFEGTLRADTLSGTFRDGEATGTFRLTRSKKTIPKLPEEEVTFKNGEVTLAGTVMYPSGTDSCPGIIFLHGSGSEGRWASRFLANAFARRGIAALIYDKRGVGKSTGNWREIGFTELVKDASAAVEALRAKPRIAKGRVGIHGHSQGGTIAPWVAAESSHVAFVVASAGAGMSMAETEIYSLGNSVGIRDMTEDERKLADRYIHTVVATAYKGAPRGEMEKAWEEVRDRSWVFPLPADSSFYWAFSRRIDSYDPLRYWREVSAPALLVYGENDQRVPPRESAAKIAEAYLHAKGTRLDVEIFPGADHTLRLRPSATQKFEWPKSAPGYPDHMIEWVMQVTNPRLRTEPR